MEEILEIIADIRKAAEEEQWKTMDKTDLNTYSQF
jgi:hypothetical protein